MSEEMESNTDETPYEVGLVGCTKSKKDEPSIPQELYSESKLFQGRSEYAKKNHDEWYILSAKHGVLDPEGPEIEPYDETLKTATVDEKREWSSQVADSLAKRDVLTENTKVVIHAGEDYYEELLPLVEDELAGVDIPTKGKAFASTRDWYKSQLDGITGNIGNDQGDDEPTEGLLSLYDINERASRSVHALELHPIYNEIFSADAATDSIDFYTGSIDDGLIKPPVIDENNSIIGDAEWWFAAKECGIEEIPVIIGKSDDPIELQIARADFSRELIFSEKARLVLKLEPWAREEADKRKGRHDVPEDEQMGRWEQVAQYIPGWAKSTAKRGAKIYQRAEQGDKAASKYRDQLDSGTAKVTNVWKELQGYTESESTSDDEGQPPKTDPSKPQSAFSPRRRHQCDHPLSKRSEHRHLPVLGFGWRLETTLPKNGPIRVNDKHLTWWNEKSIQTPTHPYVFIEPVGHEVEKVSSFAETLGIGSDDIFVLSDSGGYQVRTHSDAQRVDSPEDHSFKEENIHPGTLLEWQVANADAGTILDDPPPQPDGETDADWVDEFELRLEFTQRNAREMSKRLVALRDNGNKSAQEFAQLAVLHGRKVHGGDPWAALRQWDWHLKRAMSQDDYSTIEGYAIKPFGKSLAELAFQLAYLATECQFVNHVHILQAGGYLEHALLEYFAKRTGFFVTSDSAAAIQGSKSRQYNLPGNRNASVRITNRDNQPFTELPCTCSVCTEVSEHGGIDWLLYDEDKEDEEWLFEEDDGEDSTAADQARAQAIDLHNLNLMLNRKQTISALVAKEDDVLDQEFGDGDFWEYMQTEFSKSSNHQLNDAMRQVKIAAETGDLDRVKDDSSFTVPQDAPVYTFDPTENAMEW